MRVAYLKDMESWWLESQLPSDSQSAALEGTDFYF